VAGNISNPIGGFGFANNLAEDSQFDSGQLPPSGGAKWLYFCDHATYTANTTDLTAPAAIGGGEV